MDTTWTDLSTYLVCPLNVLVDQDDITAGKGVAVATIHSAKGLEWDVVFVMRQNEGACPHGWWPSEDEQKFHGIMLPEFFESFAILREWDPLITDGVWPDRVGAYPRALKISLCSNESFSEFCLPTVGALMLDTFMQSVPLSSFRSNRLQDAGSSLGAEGASWQSTWNSCFLSVVQFCQG